MATSTTTTIEDTTTYACSLGHERVRWTGGEICWYCGSTLQERSAAWWQANRAQA